MNIFPLRSLRLMYGVLVLSLTFGCTVENASFVEKSGGSKALVSIEVSPTNPSIALGTKMQFTAMGIYSDTTSRDLTADVIWSSSSTTVATVGNAPDPSGLATSVAGGSTTIIATLSGVSGGTTLTTTAATLVSIQVAPTNPSIALGTTLQFTATGTYSDTTSQDLTAAVTWSSSSTTVATISNTVGSNGLATAVAVGPTTIIATLSGILGSTTLTVTSATLVSIAVTPANRSIAVKATLQFTATGTYSDNSTQDLTASVTWISSDNNIATIRNSGQKGQAKGVSIGSVTITATLNSVSGFTTLTVN